MWDMKTLYQRLTKSSEPFDKAELTSYEYIDEIAIPTGCVYGDQTDIILYITQRNGALILTDNGRTRAYMDKVFELQENDVIKNIMAAANYYGISTKDKQLSLTIESMDSEFKENFLRMVYCIGFLDIMKVFYV